MKGLAIGESPVSDRYIIGATALAFSLIMLMPHYSLLAYVDHGDRVTSSPDAIFFRVLEGNMNVCSPDYQHNVTVCEVVMKDEELSPYVGKIANSIHTNNTTNFENSTNGYPPLSVNPEIVISEEQLQALLANSTLNTLERDKSVNHMGNGTSQSNNGKSSGIVKIYVDQIPQYDPLVIEQPLEGEIIKDNSLHTSWQRGHQQPFTDNVAASNGVNGIEEPMRLKGVISQEENHQDSTLTKEDSSLGIRIDNPKTDTSNSYSSIPVGISFPHIH